MKKLTTLLSVLALGLSVLLSGCSSCGTSCWNPCKGCGLFGNCGSCCATVNSGIKSSHEATKAALTDMGFKITCDSMDCGGCHSRLEGCSVCGDCCSPCDKTTVTVCLRSEASNLTEIHVSAGGCDKCVCDQIIANIKNKINGTAAR